MRIVTLSLSGNVATERQTVAVARALRDFVAPEEAEISSYMPFPPQGEAITTNTARTWQRILSLQELVAVKCENGLSFSPPWPDVIVSCRPEVAALALSIKAASDGKTRVVHIQNPNNANGYNFPLDQFDLIVRQPHEAIRGPNVISRELALHDLDAMTLRRIRTASQDKVMRIRQPLLVVLVGGSDEHVTLTSNMFHAFGRDIKELAAQHKGTVAVVTSRRTGATNKTILRHYCKGSPNLLFDSPLLPYKLAVATASFVLVTSESLSMATEAKAAGTPCILYDFHGALRSHPVTRALEALVREGEFSFFPAEFKNLTPHRPFDETARLGAQIAARILSHNTCG